MLAIPGFSLPGFFLHPADCPSLRTGKGRKRGFDKRESLGRERGRGNLSEERFPLPSPNPSSLPPKTVNPPGKAGGLKRGNRSKRFLLFAYGELQQLKLLHLPVFFFLVPYVEPNFPFSYSYRAYKISSRPETRSCYFTNFFKMFRYLNSAFSF